MIGQKIINYSDIIYNDLVIFDERLKIYKIGIQALPNTEFIINKDKIIKIGNNGIFELELNKDEFIIHLKVKAYKENFNDNDNIQIDFIYENIVSNEEFYDLNAYITPQQYGAKADGSTNDLEAFKAMFNSHQGEKGITYFIPSGKYYFEPTIGNFDWKWPYNCRIIGDLNVELIFAKSELKKRRTINIVSNTQIENLKFKNCSITFTGSNIYFNQVIVDSSIGRGFVFEFEDDNEEKKQYQYENIKILNCIAQRCVDTGFAIYNHSNTENSQYRYLHSGSKLKNIVFENCISQYNEHLGFSIQSRVSWVENCLFKNCYAINNSPKGCGFHIEYECWLNNVVYENCQSINNIIGYMIHKSAIYNNCKSI